MTVVEAPNTLDIRPLSGTIGAEIRGVDLKAPLSEATVAEIRAAWLQHKVVFFPGQHLEPAEHVAFARNFGEPTPAHPVTPGITGYPEVLEIDYTKARLRAEAAGITRSYNASNWHTDVTFIERPPLGSILNAVVIPPNGGDTQFADTEAAYDALSDTLKAFLGTLTAEHTGAHAFGASLRASTEKIVWEGEVFDQLVPVVHPVVRTHPETGRKSLFVNPGFTVRIVELTEPESANLLKFLYGHIVQPEFVVRYHWTQGDLGFWDNRSTQHAVVQDFGLAHRVIQRVTLFGDEPV